MKKIIAAITMACLALCYYNVDAKKSKKKTTNTVATQTADQNKESTSESKKNKKNKKKNKKGKRVSEEMIQIDNNRIDDGKLSKKSRADYEKAAEEWISVRSNGRNSSVQDDEVDQDELPPSYDQVMREVDQDELPPSYDQVMREKVKNGEITRYEDESDETESQTEEDESDEVETQTAEKPSKRKKADAGPQTNKKISKKKANAKTQTEISSKDLKKKIKEIVGDLKDEEAEEAAIAKVSKILDIPEEFLVVPQTLYGAKGKKKVCLIVPENSQIPNRSLLVVFREYRDKLKDTLSIFEIPAVIKENAKTKAKKQDYYKKSGEIYDKKKNGKIETYYEMPTKEEILSRVENVSDTSDDEDED